MYVCQDICTVVRAASVQEMLSGVVNHASYRSTKPADASLKFITANAPYILDPELRRFPSRIRILLRTPTAKTDWKKEKKPESLSRRESRCLQLVAIALAEMAAR